MSAAPEIENRLAHIAHVAHLAVQVQAQDVSYDDFIEICLDGWTAAKWMTEKFEPSKKE